MSIAVGEKRRTVGGVGAGPGGQHALSHFAPKGSARKWFDINPRVVYPQYREGRVQAIGDLATVHMLFVSLNPQVDKFGPSQPYGRAVDQLLRGTIDPEKTIVVDWAGVMDEGLADYYNELGLPHRVQAHTLEGPRSGSKKRHIVVANVHGRAAELVDMWDRRKDLEVIERTPDEHDWDMSMHGGGVMFRGIIDAPYGARVDSSVLTGSMRGYLEGIVDSVAKESPEMVATTMTNGYAQINMIGMTHDQMSLVNRLPLSPKLGAPEVKEEILGQLDEMERDIFEFRERILFLGAPGVANGAEVEGPPFVAAAS